MLLEDRPITFWNILFRPNFKMKRTEKKHVEEKAMRYNAGKVRLGLVPAEFTEMLALVFEAGAKKYSPWNWTKSLNTEDHDKFINDRLDSLLRHVQAYRTGEWTDAETKCPHLVQVAWNALVIVWYHAGQTR